MTAGRLQRAKWHEFVPAGVGQESSRSPLQLEDALGLTHWLLISLLRLTHPFRTQDTSSSGATLAPREGHINKLRTEVEGRTFPLAIRLSYIPENYTEQPD